jgi:hypothetical protein
VRGLGPLQNLRHDTVRKRRTVVGSEVGNESPDRGSVAARHRGLSAPWALCAPIVLGGLGPGRGGSASGGSGRQWVRDTAAGNGASRAGAALSQGTFNPRVQGSIPWGATRQDTPSGGGHPGAPVAVLAAVPAPGRSRSQGRPSVRRPAPPAVRDSREYDLDQEEYTSGGPCTGATRATEAARRRGLLIQRRRRCERACPWVPTQVACRAEECGCSRPRCRAGATHRRTIRRHKGDGRFVPGQASPAAGPDAPVRCQLGRGEEPGAEGRRSGVIRRTRPGGRRGTRPGG